MLVFAVSLVAAIVSPHERLLGVASARMSAAWSHYNAARALVTKTLLLPHHGNVAMRDGVELWTTYWDPRLSSRERLPTVFVRSPYGENGTERVADLYVPFGFAVVTQDMRGTGQSGGDFMYFTQSGNDGHDTMSWIAAQPWSNGVVSRRPSCCCDSLGLLLSVFAGVSGRIQCRRNSVRVGHEAVTAVDVRTVFGVYQCSAL